MSINAHHGVEQSRRDDMESIGYVLVYFMKLGKLPWMGLKTDDVRERYKMIGHIKEDITTSKLTGGINREFGTYLRYVKSLKFADRPDYNYLKSLFRNCLKNNQWLEDNVFDWMILASEHPTPTPGASTTISPAGAGKSEQPPRPDKIMEKLNLNNNNIVDTRTIIVEELAEGGNDGPPELPECPQHPGNVEIVAEGDGEGGALCCSPCVSVLVLDIDPPQVQALLYTVSFLILLSEASKKAHVQSFLRISSSHLPQGPPGPGQLQVEVMKRKENLFWLRQELNEC